jgi:hypothetical protein
MCENAQCAVEQTLATVARRHCNLQWLVTTYAGANGSVTPDQRKLLKRHIRNMEVNHFTDTVIIAGSEVTMFTDLVMWNASRLKLPIWNFAFPGSDLDNNWHVFCQQKVFD